MSAHPHPFLRFLSSARLFFALSAALLLAQNLHALGATGAREVDDALLVRDVYVNASTGNDLSGAGTEASPYATLEKGLWKAAQYNANNLGVKVHMAPGVYEEGSPGDETAINFPGLATSAPIVIEGEGWSPGLNTGDVILSGSSVWTGWTDLGGGEYRKPWPYQLPAVPHTVFGADHDHSLVPDMVRIASGLFVNGEPYYVFEDDSDPNIAKYLKDTEGYFWYNLGGDGVAGGGDDSLHVKLPASTSITNLNDETVHVSTRAKIIHLWREGTITYETPIVFRNLVVRHAASMGIMSQNFNGEIYEDLVFVGNKLRGLNTASSTGNLTVRRCEFLHNGEQTLGGHGRNLLYEDIWFHHNSRQSYLAEYHGWGIGAFKLGESDGVTMRRILSEDNWGLGAWFDTGMKNTELVDSIIINNTHAGLFIENNNSWNIADLGSSPTVVVDNCYFAGNQKPADGTGDAQGVKVGETENAIIRNTYIGDNDVQLQFYGLLDRGPQENNQFYNNIIGSTSTSQSVLKSNFGIGGWRTWFDTLSGETDNNAYFYPGSTNSAIFKDRDLEGVNFANWKSAHLNNTFNTTGNKAVDANSTMTATAISQKPMVSIAAKELYINETEGSVEAFEFKRVGLDLSSSLTIHYSVRADAGDATNGTDHTALPGSITIPADAWTATLSLDPVAGDGTEALETVHITIDSSSDYVSVQDEAECYIEDENGSLPTVSVRAEVSEVSENGGLKGVWRFFRTGTAGNALDVNVAFSGNAVSGSDYAPLAGTVSFAAGESYADLELTLLNDSTPEIAETATVTLQANVGVYGVDGNLSSADIRLIDDDVISVSEVTESSESGGAQIVVPITLYNPGDASTTYTISTPDDSYEWTASTLPGGSPYSWVEIIDNANPADNGTALAGPGVYTTYDDPAPFTQSDFTWVSYNGNGYSGGMYRDPLPNDSSETSRGSDTLALGFNFPYFDSSYSDIYLHSHGFLSVVDSVMLEDGYEWSAFYGRVKTGTWFQRPSVLPSTDPIYPSPKGGIFGFWNDIVWVPGESSMYYKAFADMFVVTYDNFKFRSTVIDNRYTFQVILHKSGDITFQYKSLDFTTWGGGYSVGLLNEDLSDALNISFGDGFLEDEMSIQITRLPQWVNSSVPSLAIAAGSNAQFNFLLDPTGLEDGIHTIYVPITSNDPNQPEILLPVTFAVGNLAGDLQLTQASGSVSEVSGTYEIKVERVNGISGAVSVDYAVTAGTATSGEDYTVVSSGTLSWADGELADKTITLTIVDDSDVEGDETLAVNLSNPSGDATIGTNSGFTLTIIDNEQPISGSLVLTSTAVTPQQIDLSWSHVENETAFEIQRSLDGSTGWTTLSSTVAQDTFSYSDLNLTPDTSYYYRIRAYNAVDSSAWATSDAATLPNGDLTITFGSSSVLENAGTLSATITRAGDTSDDMIVELSSNNARASVPENVTIPAGQSGVGFTVTLNDDAIEQGDDVQVVIEAISRGTFVNESFNYTPGEYLDTLNGGNGWSTPWSDCESPLDFVVKSHDATLEYADYGYSGGFAEGSLNGDGSSAYRDLATPINSGSFYFSLLTRVKPGSYTSHLYFGFDNGDHEVVRSWMDLRFRINIDNGHKLEYHDGSWIDTGLTTGSVHSLHLFVAKLDFAGAGGSDDTVSIWLNPDLSEGETTPDVVINKSIPTIARLGIAGWWKDAQYDEIRFADTFSGLTGSAADGQNQFSLRDDEANPMTALDTWRNDAFGTTANSGDAADAADPDGDGVVNLLEYAYHTAPTATTSAGDLPKVQIVNVSSQDYIAYQFRRSDTASNLVYSIETSSDLSTWTTLWSSNSADNTYLYSHTDNGDGSANYVIRHNQSIGSDKQFLRLRVDVE